MKRNDDKCWLTNVQTDSVIKSYSIDSAGAFEKTIETEMKILFGAERREYGLEVDVEFVKDSNKNLKEDGFEIKKRGSTTIIQSRNGNGLLYGMFELLRNVQQGFEMEEMVSNPDHPIRMINHWDNIDGSVERGYAGRSFFFEENQFIRNWDRIKEYTRLMASVGINAIAINNVNVHRVETELIARTYLEDVATVASIFREYGIQLFLSVNYAAPLEIGATDTADPLDQSVRDWWMSTAKEVYESIPDFGGFLVKADSENRPGPFTYGRTHADGANMLARALKPYGGSVLWRCFVYDNHQDWRDRTIDRARAAYDHFKERDGEFLDNVVLQIKNGPMDFQIREAVSPLFGALRKTNQLLEFQIAQEYTGQQKHICYLVPLWKEVLDFDTFADGEGTTVTKVLQKHPRSSFLNGITAVSNVGRDENWTGHILAQANLYGFGRLCWDSSLSSSNILDEWIAGTFELDEQAKQTMKEILLSSRDTYEKYTSPLGIGWMVEPNHHYGPNIDGYEYSMWGTYHFSDRNGLGVDRTVATGTGYTRQYYNENFEMYEDLSTCPDELLLFFHHVPYTHKLHSGKTVIQHIYDTHFEGVEKVEEYIASWKMFENQLPAEAYQNGMERLGEQLRCAKEWRDQVNTYYYRKSGIEDEHHRKIYA